MPATTAVDSPSVLERVLRRDRVVIASGVFLVVLLAWIYLGRMAGGMRAEAMAAMDMAAMGMPEMHTWNVSDFVMLFLMWSVMMVAMMLPSAAPLMLLVAGTYRRRGRPARGLTAAFAGGYLVAWTVFSALAAAAQVGLHQAALLSPGMAASSPALAGGILVLAGVYQFLPAKEACLTHCRSPFDFLTHHWREGMQGAVVMGIRHGLYCVGCCWALMALLFVAGVMNLMWVAAIAAFVLVEKLMPRGVLAGRMAGVLLIAWGTYAFLHRV
jgi:predicted metal-binding membrane protein